MSNALTKKEFIEACEGFEFYACDGNPNGTNDLLITAEGDSEILNAVPEVLFGINCKALDESDQLITHSYQSHVSPIEAINDVEPEYLHLVSYVRHMPAELVYESLAVSPVRSANDQLRDILDALVVAGDTGADE
jgi:hypothetical protein